MTDTPVVPDRQPARPPEDGAGSAELREGIDYAGRQIRGSRELQEDCYGVVPREEFDGAESDLFVVVADGMGGYAAGEVASGLAVETFAQSFLQWDAGCDAARLWYCLEEANRRIQSEIASRGEAVKGMGTTLLAVLKRAGTLRWISVGDSPLYLLRGGRLLRINELHSHAAELAQKVDRGEISAEQAATDPGRHTLNSALIGETIYQVDDSPPIPLQSGDVVLAASDGIHTLDDAEIEALTARGSQGGNAGAIAETIIEAVVEKNKQPQDNTTLVVIRIT